MIKEAIVKLSKRENLDIDTVVANGRVMIENKEILVYGSYEQI